MLSKRKSRVSSAYPERAGFPALFLLPENALRAKQKREAESAKQKAQSKSAKQKARSRKREAKSAKQKARSKSAKQKAQSKKRKAKSAKREAKSTKREAKSTNRKKNEKLPRFTRHPKKKKNEKTFALLTPSGGNPRRKRIANVVSVGIVLPLFLSLFLSLLLLSSFLTFSFATFLFHSFLFRGVWFDQKPEYHFALSFCESHPRSVGAHHTTAPSGRGLGVVRFKV